MIIIGDGNNKKLEFEDQNGNSAGLYYREPTPEERISYSNGLVKAKGRKIKFDTAGVRMRAGRRVCTGMVEGDWAIKVSEEENPKKYVLISSDPKSPHYRKDWKDLLWRHHGGYLMLLGQTAFEDVTVDGGIEDEEDNDDLFDDDLFEEDSPLSLVTEEDERGKSSEISNL